MSTNTLSANTVSANTVSTYTVVSGDCLSTIALRFYGDEGAWNEIWAANANRVMADGMRFGDPNLIYPGWVLVLPGLPGASPTEPTPTDPTPSLSTHPPASKLVPAPSADSPRADGQRGGSGLGESGPGQTKAASAPTTNPASAQPRRGQAGVGAPGEAGTPHGAGSSAEAPVRVGGDALTGAVVHWVPESASLGISVLVAAAYLRRIRRRRAQARAARGDDEAVADPDPAAVRLEVPPGPFCRRAGARVARARQSSSHVGAARRGQRRIRRGPGSSGSGRPGSRCCWRSLSTGPRDPSCWAMTERAGGCPPTSIARCSGPTHARSWLGCPCCCPSATTPAGHICCTSNPATWCHWKVPAPHRCWRRG